mgnify:CR=1 FL=1
MLIPMGGITGIAMILNFVLGLPLGALNLLLNIPLLMLGYRGLGREFFFKTVFGTVVVSLLMDAVGPAMAGLGLSYETHDMLLSAMAGGAVMGLGNGIVIRQGATSGGSDILAKYVAKRFDMRVGTFGLYFNAVVLTLSAFIYGGLEGTRYAMITIFVYNMAIDRMVYGADIQKQALIITDQPTDVADAIMARLGRGVTAWDGKGMYTGDRRAVLLCAVHRNEAGVLKAILQETDVRAVLLLSEVNEIFGAGFKKYSG